MQVWKFKYLGIILTEDGKCDVEIQRYIEMATAAF